MLITLRIAGWFLKLTVTGWEIPQMWGCYFLETNDLLIRLSLETPLGCNLKCDSVHPSQKPATGSRLGSFTRVTAILLLMFFFSWKCGVVVVVHQLQSISLRELVNQLLSSSAAYAGWKLKASAAAACFYCIGLILAYLPRSQQFFAFNFHRPA